MLPHPCDLICRIGSLEMPDLLSGEVEDLICRIGSLEKMQRQGS
ncbi:hypothetical protein MITSMUL_05269 [Mitsuokella multacida DSM 20544]|uniref:Uncharacterized protein n=1 Tax=Mitsuokella multacida DSM 20544 TaxID=500635 RepID=C9KPW1_9FIRM|nr:hypothetical protein MITSMUL_05269 [Mitsuokella multacida DSM 20544]